MNNSPSHTREERYSRTPNFGQGGYPRNLGEQLYHFSFASTQISSNSSTSNPQFHAYDSLQAPLEGHYNSLGNYQDSSSSGPHVSTHCNTYDYANHMEGQSTERDRMHNYTSSQVLPHHNDAPFPTHHNTEQDDSLPSESGTFGASLPIRPEWILRPTSHPMVQSQRAYICKLHGCTSPGNIVLKSHKAIHERSIHGVKPYQKQDHKPPKKKRRRAVSPHTDVILSPGEYQDRVI